MLSLHIYNSSKALPRELWDLLLENHSCTYAAAFWDLLEEANLNDFRYQYLLLLDEHNNPVAIAGCYTVTTDLAIFSTGRIKRLLQGIRTIFPNFFKVKMLECGTPVILNAPLVISSHVDSGKVIDLLCQELLRLIKQQGQHLIVVRDFEPASEGMVAHFQRHGFHFVEGLPTTYLEIRWRTLDEYLVSMKSYYRSKLLKHLRINQKTGIRHELKEDFADMAEELCAQWLNVHQHAKEYQRDILTPEFYRGFSRMGSQSKVLLFWRNDTLVGHALLLLDMNGALLRWLYFGRTEVSNDSLYLYVAYSVVETAIALGARKLELGLTTYPVKRDIGAYMSPVCFALRSPWDIANPLVSMLYPLLNQTPVIRNKNIFKDERKEYSLG